MLGGGISKTISSLRSPLKLCTFSRVLKEKGIENAIDAVTCINEQNKREIFSLDIYGQIDDAYKEEFMMKQKNFPEYINYGGVIPFDRSSEVLKDYYALIFPTYYEGEGFAGTLIDAMAAGVPVIASDWKYNTEIVNENITGILFPAQDTKILIDKLMQIYTENMWWNHMKKESLKQAFKYLPQNTIQIFIDNLE